MTERTDPDYVVIFDGGSRGNPGLGYGSYILRTKNGQEARCQLTFDGEMTNNEAEYKTLIAALDDLISRIRSKGKDPSAFTLEVRGDSELVLKQLRGEYRIRTPHLYPLWEAARARLRQFRTVRLVWQSRNISIAELGH